MTEDERPATDSGEPTFAELLKTSDAAQRSFSAGEQVESVVLKITDDCVFIDIGRKEEGIIDARELRDAEGAMTVAEGGTITAFFLSGGDDGLRFTVRLPKGEAGRAALRAAMEDGVPVPGTVAREIKGGFEVKLAGGVRGFCPYSQMDLRRVENGAAFVGQELPFRITEIAERGRSVIVSRRALLEEEQAREREAARARLREGMTVNGRVTSIRDFGVFLDVGGIEGLLPASEVGWSRVDNLREAFTPGQEVTVAVKALDWARNRITFSLRDTLPDPWVEAAKRLTPGTTLQGRVARLAPFGAFVTLADGVDGLLHISKIGRGKRIKHPKDELSEGQTLEVTVEKVDRAKRQISLTLAGATPEDQEREIVEEYKAKAAPPPAAPAMGSFGELLRARLDEKKR